jgi:hypothetical protein
MAARLLLLVPVVLFATVGVVVLVCSPSGSSPGHGLAGCSDR